MPIPRIIEDYLSEARATYEYKHHPVAYTAQEVAAVDHIAGGEFAKTVILVADGKLAIAVAPADRIIDMEVMKTRIGCNKLELASEREFSEQFHPCQIGAMPPFGRLFGITVFCDRTLAERAEIEFNAGTHVETIRMPFSEFAQLETPILTDFSQKAAGQRTARAA